MIARRPHVAGPKTPEVPLLARAAPPLAMPPARWAPHSDAASRRAASHAAAALLPLPLLAAAALLLSAHTRETHQGARRWFWASRAREGVRKGAGRCRASTLKGWARKGMGETGLW